MAPTRLHVHVVGCKALVLRGKDARTGSSNAETFCVIEFGKEKFATRSLATSRKVEWNEDAFFNLRLPEDGKRYVMLKVLQKSTRVLSLDDDQFIGQVAINIGEFLQSWDPNDAVVRKNNYPLTSKHGKTNKDRGFIEFKIAFQGVGKQSNPVPSFQKQPQPSPPKPVRTPPVSNMSAQSGKSGHQFKEVGGGDALGHGNGSQRGRHSPRDVIANGFNDGQQRMGLSPLTTTNSVSTNQLNTIDYDTQRKSNSLQPGATLEDPNDQPGQLKRSSSMRKLWNAPRGSFSSLKKKVKSKMYSSTSNLATIPSSVHKIEFEERFVSNDSGIQDKYGSRGSLASSKSGSQPPAASAPASQPVFQTQTSNPPSTPPRTKPPSTLNLGRADSTASFDSSNRGHNSQKNSTNDIAGAGSSSGANFGRRLSQNSSTRSARGGGSTGFSRNQRTGSIRKKITMAEVELNDDDNASAKSSPPMGKHTVASSKPKTRLTVSHGATSVGDRESTPSPNNLRTSGYNSSKSSNPFAASTTEYDALTREQLVDLVERQKSELEYRDSQVTHLEEYVDRLLLKIISSNPDMLDHDFSPDSREVHKKLEERHSKAIGPRKFLR